MNPVWKDITYTAATDEMSYLIKQGGSTLYRGLASAYPDGTIEIPVNKICADFLDSSLPDFRNISDSAVTQSKACRTFTLNGLTGSSIQSYTFYNDWSYEYETNLDRILSNPINGHMDGRMKLFYSVVKMNSGNICYSII